MKNFYEPDDEHDFDDMRNVPQYAIERYSAQVEEILDILSMQERFVSDHTQVIDFNFSQFELDMHNRNFKEKWGIEIDEDDFIWEIAEEIYENQF